jgi:hypothetical protein
MNDSDAELVCLAVAQLLLGCNSEPRWLRFVGHRLRHLFPLAAPDGMLASAAKGRAILDSLARPLQGPPCPAFLVLRR